LALYHIDKSLEDEGNKHYLLLCRRMWSASQR
jgi:hypothetical protein